MKRFARISILLLVIVFLASTLPAAAIQAASTVTVDGAVSTGTLASGSNISITHTTGTGSDRLMLVGVSWNCGTGSANQTISSVQFTPTGGSAVTLQTVITQKAQTANRYAAIYSYLNPPSGQAGTVAITFSASVPSGIVAGAINFAGVDQSTPLGTATGAGSPDNSGKTPSVSLTGLTGNELVFDMLFIGGASQTLAVGSGQTLQWNKAASPSNGAASIKPAAGDSVTMSWSATVAGYWAIAAVPIKPAPTGPTHTLNISVDPAGSGATSPSVGAHTYPVDSPLSIIPIPAAGYKFDHWSGDISGSDNPLNIVLSADLNITANFVAKTPCTLTVNISPEATAAGCTVSKTPAAPYYTEDATEVTLTANPATGWIFSGWSGDLDGSTNPATVTMDTDKNITANFILRETYSLDVTVSPAEAATAGCTVGKNHAGPYYAGDNTVVTLTPDGTSRWSFDNWSGSLNNSDNPATVTMDGNKSITANFKANPLYVDGTASTGTGAPTNSSVAFNHTTGTGSDRLLLVGISWNAGTTNPTPTISSVTFTPTDGSPTNLSEAITQVYNWSTNNYRGAAIYSLTNPPSGQSGTIDVTFSGAVSNGIVAGAANFTGVDQTAPLGIKNGNTGTGTGTAAGAAPTITLTGLNGNELVFDTVFIGASSTSHTLAQDAGQTALWNILGYTSSSSFNARGAASYERATSSSVTMSWTPSGYDSTATRWAIVAVAINPASGTPVNNPPVAIADSYGAAEDTLLSISAPGVLGNDTDSDTGDTLTAVLGVGPTHGILVLNSDGSFSYTPDANYNGSDTFTYYANDGAVNSDLAAIVTINVAAVNDIPTADAQSVTADYNTAKDITLTGSDVENSGLTFSIVEDPDHGTLSAVTGASVTYTPAAGYSGEDSFTFKVNDGTADSAPAAVSITVGGPGNQAPVVSDIPNQTVAEGTAFATITLDDYVVDPDNDDAALTWTYSGNIGLIVTITNRVATITVPGADWTGSETITFTATDPGLLSDDDSAAFTVTAVEEAAIQGVTFDVLGIALADITLTLAKDSTNIQATSGTDGSYQIKPASIGTWTLTASKTGYRSQTQTVEVSSLDGSYTIDFKGNTSLVPDAMLLEDVLACINKWKSPPSDGTALNLSKILAVINAWKYPIDS